MDIFNEYKNFILFGMFGSGKTELAIHFAINLKQRFELVAIADIDTVSPYFRSRDEKEHLENLGIQVLIPPDRFSHGDLPMIVPQVGGYLQNQFFHTVVDVGGDDNGATVLGSLSRYVTTTRSVSFFVVNTRRPFSATAKEILLNMQRLQQKSRVKVDYVIHNTHLGAETTISDIQKGEAVLQEVQQESGIAVFATAIAEFMEPLVKSDTFTFPILFLRRYMKNVWE